MLLQKWALCLLSGDCRPWPWLHCAEGLQDGLVRARAAQAEKPPWLTGRGSRTAQQWGREEGARHTCCLEQSSELAGSRHPTVPLEPWRPPERGNIGGAASLAQGRARQSVLQRFLKNPHVPPAPCPERGLTKGLCP